MYFTTLPILLSDHKHLMFYKSSRLWYFKCKYDSNGHLDHISTSSHCDLHKDANKIATQNMYMKIWCTRVASISAKSCDTAEQFKINLLLYKSMCLYTRQLRNSGLEIRMLKKLSVLFPFLNKKPGFTTQTICQNRFIYVFD